MGRLIPLLLGAAWLSAAEPAPAPLCDPAETGRILGELSGISGLKTRRPVACETISRDKVAAFLRQRIRETATPEEIRAEELTLKKLGLVPPDFDLAANTVDLLTEQAAAFYDFTRKRLYLSDAAPSATHHPALVHELAHALADQSFNLERFIKRGRKNDDGALARLAVMEGHATWLMSEYMARQTGRSLRTSPELAEQVSRSAEIAAGRYPVFDKSPLYMRATLLFPYAAGMRFQQAMVTRYGQEAFSRVFRHPPVSTQQVLHPDRYFSNVVPDDPPLPRFSARGYKKLADGHLGELDHAVLLEQYAGRAEAAELAPHWRGGRYLLLENAGQGCVVLAYASRWDSPEAARRFFQLYRRILEGKWQRLAVEEEAPGRLTGEGDGGRFVVELEGAVVSSLEGPGPVSER
jgi:hypothetical protein